MAHPPAVHDVIHVADVPAHPVVVRITHWLTAVSSAGLLVSGIAILLAHPRLYWGETGSVGTTSVVDLPLPWVFGQSGWGRSLHFLSAWVCVFTGLAYAAVGVARHHFTRDLHRYDTLQRVTYLAVVFGCFPLMIWTGLAMSPALVAVFPPIVTTFGGHQTARTIHFLVTSVLLLFVVAHMAMVWRAGFVSRLRAMTIDPSTRWRSLTPRQARGDPEHSRRVGAGVVRGVGK